MCTGQNAFLMVKTMESITELVNTHKVKIILYIIGLHIVRVMAEIVYYRRCSGFIRSIFASGSSTCRGLKFISEMSSNNMAGSVSALIF